MRVLVASVWTPFVHGGAEVHAAGLLQALRQEGHEAELVAVPFNSGDAERIPDQMLACALMSLEEINDVRVDRLIALKFPAYLVPHPDKVVWLMHQHRPAYDLWNNPLGNLHSVPRGRVVRDIIRQADVNLCAEVRKLFTSSRNISERVRRFWKADSSPLYHPPAQADQFYCAEQVEDYLLFPSRMSGHKRHDLALRALAVTRSPVRLRLVGQADTPVYAEQLRKLARDLKVDARVEWAGFISDAEKREAYARALAVLFPTFDEDYGYITLEAMLAAKAVITCSDSGGPLEFVVPGQTGLVTAPEPEQLAAAMDKLWEDRELAKKMGRAGRQRYETLGLSWSEVVRQLLA